jgi:hypothetical protein
MSTSNQSAKDAFVTVVSGSPRNGTALLLRMLQAGGLEVLADEEPEAGQTATRGFFDYFPSLSLDVDLATSDWVAGALGRGVKVMAYQLQYLSPAFAYRILFVCRGLDEARETWQTLGVERRPEMQTLIVVYGDLTADPRAQATRVAEFLRLRLDEEGMAAAALL